MPGGEVHIDDTHRWVAQHVGLEGATLDTDPTDGTHWPEKLAHAPSAGFCDEDPRVVASRGTELVGWYIEQQRERARLVWRDYDPAMCRPITKAIMRATSDSPPAHILANPHPPKCANRAQSSASAPLRNASALSRFIRQWALKR